MAILWERSDVWQGAKRPGGWGQGERLRDARKGAEGSHPPGQLEDPVAGLLERPVADLRADVVVDEVNRTDVGLDLRHHVRHLVRVGAVDEHRGRLASRVLDLLHEGLHLADRVVLVGQQSVGSAAPAHEHRVEALQCELGAHALADTRPSADDQGHGGAAVRSAGPRGGGTRGGQRAAQLVEAAGGHGDKGLGGGCRSLLHCTGGG